MANIRSRQNLTVVSVAFASGILSRVPCFSKKTYADH